MWSYLKKNKDNIEKWKIRLSKYLIWGIVNFVLCLSPLYISYLITDKINDNIILSSISFAYTLLISSIYIHRSQKKEYELLFWSTIVIIFALLILYVAFPEILPERYVCYLREHFIKLSLLVLIGIIIISFIFNLQSIEDLVQIEINKNKKQETRHIENNLKDIFDKLKDQGI